MKSRYEDHTKEGAMGAIMVLMVDFGMNIIVHDFLILLFHAYILLLQCPVVGTLTALPDTLLI